MSTHVGRSWDGPGDIEATCPCPKAPCGLIDRDNVSDECDQHPYEHMKSIRTRHSADDCPGVGRDVVVAMARTYAARNEIIREAMTEAEGYYSVGLLDAIDEYRAAVEHEAAERILSAPFRDHMLQPHQRRAAANLIDPKESK
ncbi:hypothetical protein [Streptomyces chryseus]|uniref:hypothetical protein n=1 Tax=Streptomyces chryseus TaxID=68186 RepID=UPI00167466B5|nr:hypothetical protein [Streptomyces chryseus]GGX26816.1 hypothetical protein GCM10010353_47450 [Streptomyces chryseus]